MRLPKHTKLLVLGAGILAFLPVRVQASSITSSVFATGAPISSTSPDSIVYGDGSVWVAYQNGADSAGASGSSTVARYTPAGALVNTWTIAGNVDGLRVDPSGQVWALQNNDGNSTLTVINPTTNATTPYTYGASYTNVANRGFDDVQFSNQIFLSETNPTGGTDPVIVQLTSGLASPLQIAEILNSTFTGIDLATGLPASTTITDSDSLILDPSGDLVLTGEADQEIVFVHNPGTAGQTESFLPLLGVGAGFPDDTVFPTFSSGTFYMSDTGANTVYALAATGLAPGSVYIDDGNVFGSLNLSTGVVTPIFTGVSPHGVVFVASPEPASFFLTGGALLLCAALVRKHRRG
jgi:hypothetical protein